MPMIDEHENRVKAAAEGIFHFLKGAIGDVEGAEATMNRERLLLYLEAFKSRHFMNLVEDDPALPTDIKIQISHAVSGLSKSWPQVRQLVYDDSATRFAAVAWRLASMQNQIVEAIGIRVTLDAQGRDLDLEPTELPPGTTEQLPPGDDDAT